MYEYNIVYILYTRREYCWKARVASPIPIGHN